MARHYTPRHRPGYPSTPTPAAATTGQDGAATTVGTTRRPIVAALRIPTLTPGSKPTRLKAKRKPTSIHIRRHQNDSTSGLASGPARRQDPVGRRAAAPRAARDAKQAPRGEGYAHRRPPGGEAPRPLNQPRADVGDSCPLMNAYCNSRLGSPPQRLGLHSWKPKAEQ